MRIKARLRRALGRDRLIAATPGHLAVINIPLVIIGFVADMTALRGLFFPISVFAMIAAVLFLVVILLRMRFYKRCRLPFLVAVFVAVIFGAFASAQNHIPGAKEQPTFTALYALLMDISATTENTNRTTEDINLKIDAFLAAQEIENPTEEERRSLQETLKALLAATEAERRAAAAKLTADTPDPEGAVEDLKRLAMRQEDSVADAAKTWKEIGAVAFLSDTNEARNAYQRATQLAPDDFEAWNMLGHLESRLGALARAQAAYEKVLTLGNQNTDNAVIAAALGNLGLIEQTRGNLDAAEEFHKRSLALEEVLGRKEGIANALGNLGLIEMTRGNLDAAEDYYKRSLALEEAPGRKEGIAIALGNLGVIEQIRGNLDAAADYYKRALALDEALGRKEGMAANLGNLGLIEMTRGNLDAAADYYKRSLALDEALGRKEGVANQLGNLGLIEMTRGNLDAAEDYLKRSLALFGALGRKEGVATALGNLGLIEATRGNLDAAEDYYKRSLALSEALGHREGMAIQRTNLGRISLEKGDKRQAAEDWHKALEILEGMGSARAVMVRAWLDDLEE